MQELSDYRYGLFVSLIDIEGYNEENCSKRLRKRRRFDDCFSGEVLGP